MNVSNGNMLGFAGALVALLLQLLAAPALSIGGAVPNFAIVFVMAYALVRPHRLGPVMPFALGLAFDLVSGAPVGSMAFSLLLISIVVARLFEALDNDAILVPLVLLGGGVLAVELIHALFMLAGGVSASLGDALIHVVVPCAVYEFFLGAATYLVMHRFAPRQTAAVPTNVSNVR
ncbi:MAG: rod shape-determining protein MreD [Berryella intestinalis]|uniref:rod shape-determining protein MreD n=1 Tax=Berryella intestinalis TaxID=1531429 RepID=UPI002A515934|nr:rod shape-determining protein MreD [Berryella intestinalis]MDD7369284.1 rod shape-determining protein MreD [Berryella intestinalis]MDY3129226.1 rod shape-determining protein MreD [Berryella intestinalis]